MSQDWTAKDVLKNSANAAATINECLRDAGQMRAEVERLRKERSERIEADEDQSPGGTRVR